MTSEPRSPGPLVTRRRLGGELRRMREATGLRLDDVARSLECSPSKISRLENGKGIPKSRDVRDILDVLGIDDDAERARLLDWSRTGQAKMWWQAYADVIPQGTVEYIELEWDATRIRAFESRLVHGLLQTRDYARAVLKNAWGGIRSADEVERLVDVRMQRQDALAPDHGLTLQCVLDESSLLRVVGSPRVLQGQLEHLIGLAEAEHVDVRVLPFSLGLLPGSRESMSILEFPDGTVNELVYIERRGEFGDYLAEAADVDRHREQLNEVFAAALIERDAIPVMEAAVRRLSEV